jgi:hypothetical protein
MTVQKKKGGGAGAKDEQISKKGSVPNSVLLAAWYRSRAAGKLTPELAGLIYTLVDKYSLHPSFRNYSFRDDLVSEGVLNLCANWHKFDPERIILAGGSPNPFSWMTTACYRSFLLVLHEEKNQRNIRDELIMERGGSPSYGYADNSSDNAFQGSTE